MSFSRKVFAGAKPPARSRRPSGRRSLGGLKPADYVRLCAVLVGIALVVPALAAQQKPGAKPAPPMVSAGNGTIYVGSYKGVIFEIDEATEKVTREIPISVGIPIGLTLSDDMSRIYVRDSTYEKIEVI